MSFQVGIGSSGGTVFSGATLYPSANYDISHRFLVLLLNMQIPTGSKIVSL